MSSKSQYITSQNSTGHGHAQAIVLRSEIDSTLTTQILSISVLSILVLVLIITNAALIA
ncbi:MAG: hypothetical protein K9N35_00830 [Candidatus Marinimicrobia bacterium]|nr:hypothetical protein [Candidatus Neomarinimicrobiota bacterium]